MIIVGGQNYYASDIESIAGQVPGVAPGGALAVSVSTAGGEALVLFIETSANGDATRSDLADRTRYAVSSTLGISPKEIILVPRGYLPRTSSGKLQRHHARGDDLVEEVLYA